MVVRHIYSKVVITSTVQDNQDAGFSIVTYTGTGAHASCALGHGLGVSS